MTSKFWISVTATAALTLALLLIFFAARVFASPLARDASAISAEVAE